MSAAIWALTAREPSGAPRPTLAELAALIDTAFCEADTCLSDPDAYPVEPHTCLSQTRDRLAEIQRALSNVIESASAPDLAGFPWHVYAQPQDGARWLVNAFTTRERAERFAERHPDQYGPLSIEHAEAERRADQ